MKGCALVVLVCLSTAAQAAEIPSCEKIQKRTERLTMAQVRARMDIMKIKQEWRDYVESCLKGKK